MESGTFGSLQLDLSTSVIFEAMASDETEICRSDDGSLALEFACITKEQRALISTGVVGSYDRIRKIACPALIPLLY